MNSSLLRSYKCQDWALGLALVGTNVLASTSNGKVYVLNRNLDNVQTITAHSMSVNKIRSVDQNTFATASNDSTVKVWDTRQSRNVVEVSNARKLPFLSLDFGHNMLVAGTELSGTDSELLLWDIRNPSNPVRSFVDSHNDDITEVRFHPSNSNLLLSGATDGYVNLYDLTIAEEDDALIQVINFASIHSANFLSPKRIYTLSHMETFAIHEINDQKTEEHVEPKPREFGDVRGAWDCDYVVDLYAPGYVFCGSNSKRELKMYRFDALAENFNFSAQQPTYFPGAHGDEVVRDVLVDGGRVYTAGEDHMVKMWQPPSSVASTTARFFHEPAEQPSTPPQPRETLSRKKHKKRKHKKDPSRFKPY
ncbi:hypothetical protein OGAPHI_005857 [Ogataea philodendri]|uniref:Uncharacterized protein n=1 Tax=Ogataea philodendri TaxID=1378263 RepID=A0A9P8NZZ5_9ASCO|nr:uncharacterized protein OGAPHI_005857 [Ogataea philodendri]KAH3662605.1 hypothetical protein OGAPHI_005857 [Ogataea philodendri]